MKTYESENGNTVYNNENGTWSGYINDDSDTEETFNSLTAAVAWADTTTED